MTVESIVFISTRKLEISNVATMQDNASALLFAFLPFAEEKAAARSTAIAMERPGPEDSNTLPEKDDVEKTKVTGDSPLKQAPAEMAIPATPEKVSTKNAEMAAPEDSIKTEVDSTPKEDSQEKAKLAADQDFELDVAEALKKVDLNFGA